MDVDTMNAFAANMRRLVAFVLALLFLAGGASAAGEFLRGGDISALPRMEELGAKYVDDGVPLGAEEIMSGYGANVFRMRLFVQPTGKGMVVQDLPYVIRLAKRIRKTRAKLILTLHYSDTWTNPGQQTKPVAWEELPFERLVERVRIYTRDTLSAMDREGVLPDFVAIGNEIRGGLLWPDGRIDGTEAQWLKFAALVKAAIAGIEDAGLRQRTQVILHIHSDSNAASAPSFFDMARKLDIRYDVIGLSFYPWWSEFGGLTATLDRLADAVGKDVLILETAFLYKPYFEPKWPVKNWPWSPSPCGQLQFFRDLIATAKSSAAGKTTGVVWWFPESSEIRGQHMWLAGSASLFDEQGRPLPAMTLFGGDSRADQGDPSPCAPGF